MTTSVSNAETSLATVDGQSALAAPIAHESHVQRRPHTLASRFAFLVICVAIVLSALAYGTVHYWAMALFNLGAFTVLFLWVLDSWQLGSLRVSSNVLQLPLFGALLIGLFQLQLE